MPNFCIHHFSFLFYPVRPVKRKWLFVPGVSPPFVQWLISHWGKPVLFLGTGRPFYEKVTLFVLIFKKKFFSIQANTCPLPFVL